MLRCDRYLFHAALRDQLAATQLVRASLF